MLFEGLVSALIAQALRLMVNMSSLLNIQRDMDLEKKIHMVINSELTDLKVGIDSGTL